MDNCKLHLKEILRQWNANTNSKNEKKLNVGIWGSQRNAKIFLEVNHTMFSSSQFLLSIPQEWNRSETGVSLLQCIMLLKRDTFFLYRLLSRLKLCKTPWQLQSMFTCKMSTGQTPKGALSTQFHLLNTLVYLF